MKNIWNNIKAKLSSSDKLQAAFNKVKKASRNASARSSSGGGSLIDKLINMDKPPIEKYYPAIIAAYMAYAAADLSNTFIRSYTIPNAVKVSSSSKPTKINSNARLRSEYDPITRRNIFNSDGVIPPPVNGSGDDSGNIDGPAVASNLPIKLIGTIVHANPAKSVATVEVGSSKVIPYLIKDEMDGLAELLKVERRRIVFRNTSNGRLEFIEMDKDLKFALKVGEPALSTTGSGGILKQGNDVTISRATIEKYTANIGEVLQQARAVPNRDPITGEINGFRILFIKPESIFTELGLKPGDLLQEVNGQKVTSIQQAMEMYQSLKSVNNISVNIEREGRKEALNFNVTE